MLKTKNEKGRFILNILEEIDILMIETKIKQKLKENKITNLKQLTNLKKKELIKLGFNQHEIEQIEIKLQLQGFDLKR